ncbi:MULTISPECIES: integrase [Pseudomonas]|uniref:integrase n=1 Tax=Pseudomonas sp. PS01299 TaxID=2991435 RepID=UPI00249C8301|nr:integrase [Pseudomonas sp. PS01299]
MSASAVSGLYAAMGNLGAVAPDAAMLDINFKPSSEFVLCRNKHGTPTAIYKEWIWDFNPYRLGATRVTKFRFDKILKAIGPENKALIDEVKYIIYCLAYFAGGGRLGRLSAKTLEQRWVVLRSAVLFCYEQIQKPLVGVLSLQQLFSTPVYLAAFIAERAQPHFPQMLSALLANLISVGDDRLGYRVISSRDIELRRHEPNQHPVIPTRIYLELINVLQDMLDQIHRGVESLECFVSKFCDEFYGLAHDVQKSLLPGGKANYRPIMTEVLQAHCLNEVFSGVFSCSHKRGLSPALLKMQYIVKNVIHLYTGMREQEVLRMQYDCLSDEIYLKEVVDDNGVTRDLARSVSVLSTTTKFTGYKKSESWFAPSEVVKAVKIAQAICRGLASIYKIDVDNDCPLFLNPAVLRKRNTDVGVGKLGNFYNKIPLVRIELSDIQELAQTDTKRDFYSEPEFAVGRSWPLTGHQFRRSLAFYGSNSGFISLPSLKSQYKQVTLEMARYYSNGFQNLKTIFGYYDPKSNGFVLPNSHVALEFQMGMPMAVANQLLSDVLFREAPLFGGTGSYIEKQKARFKNGEVCIEDVRADTLIRVKNCEISYRPTFLGGCSKVGRCDYFLLGDFTECLICEGAIIQPEKVGHAIEAMTEELTLYSYGSGEYQVANGDLERLLSFKARFIDKDV